MIALNQIAQGASVVFQVAGGCGLGVLDAAHEKNVFGIGVDADQGYLGPWVMTSALKKVDVAVASAIAAGEDRHPQGWHERRVRRQQRRRRLRQVEPEGACFDPRCGREAVRAPEGRQDQGHPDDRQVGRSKDCLSGRGGPTEARPVYVSL